MLKKFFQILSDSLKDADEKAQAGLSKLQNKKELTIGHHRVKIDLKIAEGGFADIYRVTDCNMQQGENKYMPHQFSYLGQRNDQLYALKRMFTVAKNFKGQGFWDPLKSHQDQLYSSEATDLVRRAYENEVKILKHIGHHQNIVKIIDNQENEKLDGYELYILLEYCSSGTLFNLIAEKCQMGFGGIGDENELIQIVNDISNGLRFLHEKSIAH